ncbi:hypothetical protein DB347_11805 [Opitutaceae bacterium EW11]|nr:hypothetical protein DB347_11805 [Opitutaceae bacterium EW11]
MNQEISIEALLKWRLDAAEHEAPPPPRASRLLELSRPWWERTPELFQGLVQRLALRPSQLAHAMARAPGGAGVPVPSVVHDGTSPLDTTSEVLYVAVKGPRLRLRFKVESAPLSPPAFWEVTFVDPETSKPLLSGTAAHSAGDEYRLEEELPPEVLPAWSRLRVTDRMPFRFILRPAAGPAA